jgi:sporulation protein YlmC with PRC-barrel domain
MTQTDHSASPRSISDVRGRKVVDNAGEDIGQVDDLLMDDREDKVRLLRVAAGGFPGLGETKSLIPADAMTTVNSSTCAT